MVSLKTRVKSNSKKRCTIKIKLIAEQHPEQLIGIKTSRVYSQIAHMSRATNKQAEKALLISALEDARIKVNIDGQKIRKDPPYVPMRADQIKLCFGLRAEKLPYDSFIHIK